MMSNLVVGQTETENYIYTVEYKKEYNGDFSDANFSINLGVQELIDFNGQAEQAVANLSMVDGLFSFSILANIDLQTSRLKLGVIQDLDMNPSLPDTNLGQLQTSQGENTGYFVKIINGKLVFETTHVNPIAEINSSSTINVQLPPTQHVSTFNNVYECFGSNQSQGQGQVLIYEDVIELSIGGQAQFNCNLNLGPVHYIDVNYQLPEIELGFITDGNGVNTGFRARIEQNWIVFYENGTGSFDLPNNFESNFSHDFSPFEITEDDKVETITYYDGLGRVKQSIIKQGGGNKEDLITPVIYDQYGRQTIEYLPFPSSNASSLDFIENESVLNSLNNFYLNKFPESQIDATSINAYSEKSYESSPLNRIVKQSYPGNDWKLNINGDDHSVKLAYKLNKEEDEVKQFSVIHPNNNNNNTENTELVFNGMYQPNVLSKSITKNENWTSNQVNEKDFTNVDFVNKQGKTILKRVYNNNEPHDTYYVYDDFGNLTYVIPPLASDEIVIEGTQGFIANNISFPWTDLVQINKSLADLNNRKLVSYKDKEIKDADLTNKYGAQGGFTLTTFADSDIITLNISVSSNEPFTLKQGDLISLKEYGEYKDTELGKVNNYVFLIKNNNIVIETTNKKQEYLSSINETFSSNTKLTYSTDYLWTNYTDVDPRFAKEYETAVYDKAKELNQSILNTFVENPYNGQGGVNISIDENDIISISINSSTSTLFKLKQGIVIPLNTKRRMSDREVGLVSGENFSYNLYIKENSLYIRGDGQVNNLNYFFTSPPPTESSTINSESVEGLCYIYHYDHKNRFVEKKIPGKDWEHTVYDKLDRPILVQDGKLRATNKWLFTKYDKYNRVVYSGIYENSNTRIALQNILDNQNEVNEYRLDESSPIILSSDVSTELFYTNNTYPSSGNISLHSINYYDNYDINLDNEFGYQDSYGQILSNNNKNQATVSKIRVLETDYWTTTATYYDHKGRAIFVASKNEFLNSYDSVKTKLNFAGNILETNSTHTKDGNSTNIVEKFIYDHANRLLTQTQSINSSQDELLTNNTYDELGNLIIKKIGGVASTNPADSQGLQTINYAHNVRGWITSINNGQISNGDLFGYAVKYNNPFHSNSLAQYNGNISEIHWITANDQVSRNYQYDYDALNRITNAHFNGGVQNFPNNVSQPVNQDENYSLKEVAYDKNGNIMHLERYGIHSAYAGIGGNLTMDIVDGLEYSYVPYSNKLLNVTDFADNGFNFGAPNIDHGLFLEKHEDGDKYQYDINGNLISDLNKNITEIKYNHLNLPIKIVFNGQDPETSSSAKAILFTYDASGVKQQKYVVNNTLHDYTQYASDFIYTKSNTNNFVLKNLNHSEGYLEPKNDGTFSYIYQYKDHLDNVRLSFSDDNGDAIADTSEIIEEKNYYPFGGEHSGYNNFVNGQEYNYRTFQGQESNKEFGLNWTSFKWRNHDPSIGRFMSLDPLSEKFYYNSTYAFSENKVISYFELEGLESVLSITLGQEVKYRGDILRAAHPDATHVNINSTSSSSATSSFVDAFKNSSSSDPAGIGFVAIWGHGSSGKLYTNDNFTSSIKTSNLEKLNTAIKNGEISFTGNAVIFIGNCNAGTCSRNATTSLAQRLSEITGATVIGANDSVGLGYPTANPENTSTMRYIVWDPNSKEFIAFDQANSKGIGPSVDVVKLMERVLNPPKAVSTVKAAGVSVKLITPAVPSATLIGSDSSGSDSGSQTNENDDD